MKINSLVTNTLLTKALASQSIAPRSLVALVSKPLVKNMLVKHFLLMFSCLLFLGCAQQPDYILTTSNQQIKAVQILDPQAPERNDGIIATLDGNYGKNVVRKYQRSIYDMKSSRQMKQIGQ